MDIDWRFIGAVIIILIIVVSAIIAGQNISGFSFFGTSGPTKNITISASIELEEIQFNAPVEKLVIEAYSQENSLFIGNQKIDFSSYTAIEAENFQGYITAKGGLVSFDAQADMLTVNDVPITSKDSTIHFSGQNVEFYMITADNIILPPVRYEKTKGYAYINDDKFYVQLNDEPLELGAFRGSLEISDSDISFEGIVDRVLVDGESKILIDE